MFTDICSSSNTEAPMLSYQRHSSWWRWSGPGSYLRALTAGWCFHGSSLVCFSLATKGVEKDGAPPWYLPRSAWRVLKHVEKIPDGPRWVVNVGDLVELSHVPYNRGCILFSSQVLGTDDPWHPISFNPTLQLQGFILSEWENPWCWWLMYACYCLGEEALGQALA